MRIAYIAPYQGKAFLRTRPVPKNISLATNVKVELISELLQAKGHSLEILSQGEIADRRLKVYPGFSEPEPFHPKIPVRYASAFPVRFINGFWSSFRTLALFRSRHRAHPFDLVIIYNLKLPQMICAGYAARRYRLPVVLEYEDDAFVDIGGKRERGYSAMYHLYLAKKILQLVSGGVGVSPHLISQLPASKPTLLLRGVVSDEILKIASPSGAAKRNWVVYSGAHTKNKGLEQLISAWKVTSPPDWELHLAGQGELTATLEKMAAGNKSIVFHGLLNRQENARLLGATRIGVNPHNLSDTPGNVFAFKIVEYLAAGAHVITTPMGELERELESGITYMAGNSPDVIAATLSRVLRDRLYEHTAVEAALRSYGPQAVASSLDQLLGRMMLANLGNPGR